MSTNTEASQRVDRLGLGHRQPDDFLDCYELAVRAVERG